jgi:hypothetical protein
VRANLAGCLEVVVVAALVPDLVPEVEAPQRILSALDAEHLSDLQCPLVQGVGCPLSQQLCVQQLLLDVFVVGKGVNGHVVGLRPIFPLTIVRDGLLSFQESADLRIMSPDYPGHCADCSLRLREIGYGAVSEHEARLDEPGIKC